MLYLVNVLHTTTSQLSIHKAFLISPTARYCSRSPKNHTQSKVFMADRKRRLSMQPEASRSAKRQASDAHKYQPQSSPQVASAPDLSSTLVNASRPPSSQTNAVTRSSPRWNPKLRAAIHQAAKSKPRFLFKPVLVDSEDFAKFSEHGELVPYVISPRNGTVVRPHNETIEDFFSQPLEGMTELRHRNPGYDTYFTDWTPSMFKAIRKALHMSHADGAGHDVHLAILDTKLLSPSNLTVGRAALQKVFEGYLGAIPISSPSAYLVYGIISQGAFCARPLKALNNKHVASGLGYKLHHRPLDILKTSLHNANSSLAIDIAKEFGKVFDSQGFTLPATVMAIATLCQDRDLSWPDEETLVAEIVSALQEFAIESDWKHDPTIMTAATHTFDQVADRGMKLLRALADRRGMGRAMRAASTVTTDLDSLADGMLQVSLAGMAYEQSIATHDSTPDFEPMSPSTSDSEESNSSAGESADCATSLPQGRMDDETKRNLLEAQRYTPRYLFRGWRNGYAPSGGRVGLNTVDAITPSAYFKNRKAGASTIYDLTKDQLQDMCRNHLSTIPLETQLSSWASSLQVAMYFTQSMPGSHISIIDTRALRDQNIIVHVPKLTFLRVHDGSYPHEYLAHGVIDGPAHKAVPLEAFTRIGMRGPFNTASPMYNISEPSWNALKQQITAKMIKDAKIVADRYGSRFGTAVLIAIICYKQRSADLWRSGIGSHDLALITSAISEYKVPQRLCADDTILRDIVYTENYGDVEQMIRLLRAVVDWRHGKGARGRKQSAKWEDSASLLSGPPADAEEDTSREPRKKRGMRRSRK